MAEIFKQVIFSQDLIHLEADSPFASKEEAEETPNPLIIKEEARKEGYQQGFDQGLADSLKQAKTEAAKEVFDLCQQLKNLLQSIPAAISESRLQLKSEIADIVLAITQQFFIHQQQNKEAIGQQISEALKQINDKHALTLVLNPQDLALLQGGELKIDFSHCPALRIQADESLALGGCLIRSEHGLFDAGIERQIDRLKQVLLQIKKREQHD